MPRGFNYSGANVGKSPQGTRDQQYLREKAALMVAEKYYYTPDDFEQLKGDLRDGLITVRIMTTASSLAGRGGPKGRRNSMEIWAERLGILRASQASWASKGCYDQRGVNRD
jgi:hypothetical protein